jgi:hypothetical protein
LDTSRLPIAAVREEKLRIASGTEIETLDPFDARAPQNFFRGPPEIELLPTHDPSAEAGAVRLGDLLADLVAAWSDGRPDRRGERAAERLDARLDNAVEKPDSAGV